MQHSDDPNRRALAVTCYLDESATDGGSPTAVVGGILINKPDFIALDEKWKAMLQEFQLSPGLHLKDFGKHGRFKDRTAADKTALFSRAASIIIEHKIYTLAATIEHSEYRDYFSLDPKQDLTVYELGFVAAVLANRQMAQMSNYEELIPFVIDEGNPCAKYVNLVHRNMRTVQREYNFPLNLGSLTFEDDEEITALQAADVICWGARRRAAVMTFPKGLEPIETILDHPDHAAVPIPKEALKALSAHLRKVRESDDRRSSHETDA